MGKEKLLGDIETVKEILNTNLEDRLTIIDMCCTLINELLES